MMHSTHYPFSNIEELSEDRPLTTLESHVQNDFYGHASVLKQFAGLHESFVIRATIEHGGGFRDNYVWDTDREAAFPSCFVRGPYRFQSWKAVSRKALFATGPIIHYAQPALTKQEVLAVKKEWGSTLLYFPDHSTHHVKASYDTSHVVQLLEREGQAFNTVVVCLFWKDVLDGLAAPYKEAGFEVVTAGHMYDVQFLSRLKSLIQLADVTAGSRVGNQVGYSVVLGVPHRLFDVEVELQKSTDAPVFFTSMDEYDNARIVREISDAFRTDDWELNSAKRRAVEQYWCQDHTMDQRELLAVLHHCNEMYELGPRALLGKRDIELVQLRNYVKSNDLENAMELLTHCFKIHGTTPGLEYCQSLILARTGETKIAINILTSMLAKTEHKAARELLEELQ